MILGKVVIFVHLQGYLFKNKGQDTLILTTNLKIRPENIEVIIK